jgi:hypothetical protein
MADRPNPLKLNALQAKTLALLQELARQPQYASPTDGDGGVMVRYLPSAHGDHFHIGTAVVRSRDATGLTNNAVYGALARKGLVAIGPQRLPTVTAAGLAYETGLADQILHRSDH